MANFEPIPLGENDKVTAEIFNRLQRKLTEALQDSPSAVRVADAIPGDNNVAETSMFITADPSGGAIRLILPDTKKNFFFTATKTVDSKNKVTIVGQDGSPNIEVFYGADRSVTMLCDSGKWIQL